MSAKVDVASAVASGNWSNRAAIRGTGCDFAERLVLRGLISTSDSIFGVAWPVISSACFFTIEVFVVDFDKFVEEDDDRLVFTLVG